MKLLLKLLMLFFFIAFCGYTYGQNTNAVKITATFQKEPIVSILDQLAQKYPLHFYYQEEDLPDSTYTLFFRDASLNEVMKQLLAGTQLGYLNYRTYNIIIAPQSFIDESFSAAHRLVPVDGRSHFRTQQTSVRAFRYRPALLMVRQYPLPPCLAQDPALD